MTDFDFDERIREIREARHREREKLAKNPIIANMVSGVFTFSCGGDHSMEMYHIHDDKDYDFLINEWLSPYCSLTSDYDKFGPGWYVFYSSDSNNCDIGMLFNYEHYKESRKKALEYWISITDAKVAIAQKKEAEHG